MKKAFITGVTGQDGSYLLEFLIDKGYEVHAIIRRSSVFTSKRIPKKYWNHKNFKSYHGDLTDSSNLHSLISKIKPDEVYNLAAQSHVGVSFDVPEYTGEVDAIGTIRLLDAIRDVGVNTRFYQASTSELFGEIQEQKQSEKTKFYPKSPYATSKLFGYWITKNYRESYNMHASNGILFNHESPRRGETFVTKKITQAVAKIHKGQQDFLELGNIDAKRDWGYAKDYVEAMWLMLQQKTPHDLVISTGKCYTIREFTEKAFLYIGIKILWIGIGVNEVGINKKNDKVLVKINPKYYRPAEVELLLGDASKAKKVIEWESKTNIDELIKIMVDYDLKHNDYGFD